MAFRKLVERFIRSNECRVKCGDDGKNQIIPSTDFDNVDDISIIHRQCGCELKKCAPRSFQGKSCVTINYFFVEQITTQVVCQPCKSYYMERRLHYQHEPLEVLEEHVQLENDKLECLPFDLSPGVIFDECYPRHYLLQPLDGLRYRFPSPECWTCQRCESPLFSFNYDCISCDDTLILNTGFIEEDDFIDVDLDYFRQLNNSTPLSQMIKSHFVNSHISDSELLMRIDEYEREYEPLTPDNSVTDDIEPTDEDLYMKYNGYF